MNTRLFRKNRKQERMNQKTEKAAARGVTGEHHASIAPVDQPKDLIQMLISQLHRSACPPIEKAVPPWPSGGGVANWIGLQTDGFSYTHHPSHGDILGPIPFPPASQEEIRAQNLFCVPIPEHLRLKSIIENSKGGSILVTGYRGTGKTSLVNYALADLARESDAARTATPQDSGIEIPRYVTVRINLSTARTAEALVMMMIKELYDCNQRKCFDDRGIEEISRIYERFRWDITTGGAESARRAASAGADIGGKVLGFGASGRTDYGREWATESRTTQRATPYRLHEAQQDLHRCLSLVRKEGFKVVFVFDELDKLIPDVPDTSIAMSASRRIEVQTIVSDLKFLLTESNAYHIFIAGKDVDDSWQEDQNKGEGLFESVFVQNIYLPSTFRARFRAALGEHDWIKIGLHLWSFACGFRARRESESDSGLPDASFRHLVDGLEYELRKLNRAMEKGDPCELESILEFPGNWIDDILRNLLIELGIGANTWAYNTGLLILPHLSDTELWRLLMRHIEQDERLQELSRVLTSSAGDLREDVFWRRCFRLLYDRARKSDRDQIGPLNFHKWISFMMYLFAARNRFEDSRIDEDSNDYRKIEIVQIRNRFLSTLPSVITSEGMSERRSRGIRYLIQYLTYKGRGIPRKILREFYALVQDRGILGYSREYWRKRDDIKHIIFATSALRQKMKFFASIVAQLDANQDFFRNLNDKGCVATFHIIDYVLKYFQTGFSWTDIESAAFMTQKEELYPSRELVAKLLEILDDHVIERIDRRARSYKLLPRVKHDLAALYLAFGPEQIELRFTRADFAQEMKELESRLAELAKTRTEDRLETFKVQMRLAQLFELLGDYQKARHEYSKAMRWVREDLTRFQKGRLGFADAGFGNIALITYSSFAIELAKRIGFLYELEREFRTALHYYQSAVRFFEAASSLRVEIPEPCVLEDPANNGINRQRIQAACDQKASRGDRTEAGSPKHHGDEELDQLYRDLVPSMGDLSSLMPFSRLGVCGSCDLPQALDTRFSPFGLADLLNLMAICLEKLWHRYAANRYLVLALDYYRGSSDQLNVIEQLILTGELMVRRRDIRLAARCYEVALLKIADYQRRFPADLTSRQPELQSAARARLFEYLGDVYFATNGTAFVGLKTMQSVCGITRRNVDSVDRHVEHVMLRLRRKLKKCEFFDHRDEEFFYTQAAMHYGMSNQYLRQTDVAIKKLIIRLRHIEEVFENLWETASGLGQELIDGAASEAYGWPKSRVIRHAMQIVVPVIAGDSSNADKKRYADEILDLVGDLIRTWCSFWITAEQTLEALIDLRPTNRRIQALDKGRIIDRRRFGELFTLIGRMFLVAAELEISDWYWDAERAHKSWWSGEIRDHYAQMEVGASEEKFDSQGVVRDGRRDDEGQRRSEHGLPKDEIFMDIICDRVDLERTKACVDRITGFLVDNPTLDRSVSDNSDPVDSDIEICAGGEIGNRSALWRLSNLEWRRACAIGWNALPGEENGSQRWRLFEWLHHHNAFLVGPLYYMCLAAKDSLPGKNASSECEFETLRLRLRTLYRSELTLLGAHLALDNNIRDTESAEASHYIAILYLTCIKEILEFRHKIHSQTSIEKEEEEEGSSFDHLIAVFYCLLHTAAKRFFANAVDIYRAEHAATRSRWHDLGAVQLGLGELLLIRAEVLEYCRSDEKRVKRGTSARTVPEDVSADEEGKHQPPVGDVDSRETTFDCLGRAWPILDKIINEQTIYIRDNDLTDVRLQAAQAFRDACRESLSEIESYLKRYRFPNEANLIHGNIMDRRRHFSICENIRERHWRCWRQTRSRDDQGGRVGRQESENVVKELYELSRQFVIALFHSHTQVRSRQTWLRDIKGVFELASESTTANRHIDIGFLNDGAFSMNSHERNNRNTDIALKWNQRKYRHIPRVNDSEQELEAKQRRERRRYFFRSFDDGLGEIIKMPGDSDGEDSEQADRGESET